MPFPVKQGAETPEYTFPYRYGVVEYALSDRSVDPHSWLPGDEGGVIVGPVITCLPVATRYSPDCTFPEPIKSDPVTGLREGFEASPVFFEVALQESTISCPNLEETVKNSLLATIEHDVERVTLESLLLEAGAPISTETSYECALSAAVQAAGDVTNADGLALITIPPNLAVFALSNHYLKEDGRGRLVDPFGNVFRVLKGVDATRLFVEDEAYNELWLSEPLIDTLSYPKDAQRSTNTIIVRGEQAYIYVQNRCRVVAIDFACS